MKTGFIREVYLRSVPSVDLKTVEGQVDCCKHTILMSVYDSIVEEYCESEDDKVSANFFMLMSGPQLVNDQDECETSEANH